MNTEAEGGPAASADIASWAGLPPSKMAPVIERLRLRRFRDERGRVLLVKRADGRWCVPCGFCDWGEDVRAAAARECREESGIEVEIGEVMQVASNFHDPEKPTVGVWFAARAVGGTLQAGDDASDAGWFALDDLPELAFPTDVMLFEGLRQSGGQGAAGP